MNLLSLTWPIFIENMLFMLLGFIDIFVLSRHNDVAASAVSAANQVISICNLVFSIISGATAILISQSLGAEKRQSASMIAALSLLFSTLIGLIVSALSAVFHRPLLAALVAVPFFCRQMRAHCFNWVRAVFGGLFLFYVLCVLALVFFPLPDAAQAAKLTTYDAQLVPFQFVADFLRETPLVRSDVRTYLPALFDRTVQQVVCNILMLLPFGMYLRYVCGLDLGRVALVSLAFSAFIELGQLTGLFFVFRGSYRLCDVDDLMLNTLGGLLGGELVHALEAHLPPLDAFDRFPGSSALAMQRRG